MNDVIFDGENYYFFRSLNSGNREDLEKGIEDIRPDSIRYYESHGSSWGKYSDRSEFSTEELYDHVKMRYRRDTNCISLTRDANVARTYYPNDPKYVLIRYSPEEFKKVIDAGRYFADTIERNVSQIETSITDERIINVLKQIDNAESVEEIRKIVREYDLSVSTYSINERQFLTKEEGIKVNKNNAKLKVLEAEGLLRTIDGVDNSELIKTMGNAFTSSEYIHYGNINKENVFPCPKEFLEMFALIEQVRSNGTPREAISEIESELIRLVKDGYKINRENNTFGNNRRVISISERDLAIFDRGYSEKINLDVNMAFNLTKGRISYNETKSQLNAILSLAQMILKRKALINIFSEVLPQSNLDELLENTYCINPKAVIKQNQRGYRLSNTVNFLVSNYRIDLSNEDTQELINRVSSLSEEQLLEIIDQGIHMKELSNILVETRASDERIQARKDKNSRTKYLSEAIIEGYDWTKTRALTKAEKDMLAKKISTNTILSEDLEKLYNELNKMIVGNSKFSQDEIFAIIMNMAIDGRVGDVTYSALLHKSSEEINRILWQNIDEFETIVNPISLDIMMNRGKTITELNKYYIELGLEELIKEGSDNQKGIKNLYMARQIVEGYSSEKRLSQEEKGALLNCILNRERLNEYRSVYLENLYGILSKNGLSIQDINKAIVSLAINRGLGIQGYAYSSLLGSPSKIKGIQLDSRIRDITFQRAISENLSQKHQEELKEELERIGIDKEFISSKNIGNLYMAKRIVEGYNFDRTLTSNEKRAIINNILKPHLLDKDNTIPKYLSGLCYELEKKGLTEQEIYGTIINLSNNFNENTGCSYTKLLQNYSKIQQLSKREISCNISEFDIKKAVSNNLSERDIEEIYEYYRNLGLENYLNDENATSQKSIENLYIAKEILEGYNFNRTISLREKQAILNSIIKNKNLDRGRSYLSSVCRELEKIGLTEQEMYGAIINLGINGYFNELTGYDYSTLLRVPTKIQELKKEDIYCNVGNFTIQKSVLDDISDSEEAEIKEYFIGLGLDNFVDQESSDKKHINNLYVAKQVVEHIEIEESLSIRQKKALAFGILKSNDFNQDNTRYINTICQQFEKIGLSEKEIYGIIINLAINGSATKKIGYTYPNLIHSPLKIRELKKEDFSTSITKMTLLNAVSKSLSKKDEEELIEYLQNLGINDLIITQKSKENLYFAKHIIESYNFNRELSEDEKRVLLTCILNNKKLDSGKKWLSGLCMSLERLQLSEQEIYATVISLSINGAIKKRIWICRFIGISSKITWIKKRGN